MSDPSELLSAAQTSWRAGRATEAAELCERILHQHPDHLEALHCRGQIALQGNDVPRAVAVFSRAVALRPDLAVLHLQHGLALRRTGQTEAALAAFRQAIACDAQLAEAHHQAGNALKALGRFAEAQGALRTAATLSPTRAVVWLNYGVAALDAGALSDAIAAFQKAATLEPARPETHNILGHALATAGRTADARAALVEALRLRPGYAAAHDNLGRLCKSEGRLTEAVTHFRAALASTPSPNTHSNLLLALNYLPDLAPEAVFAEHRRWEELYAPPFGASSAIGRPLEATRRLRVGYLSPDFSHHAVAYFIEPVLANHDRSRVEVFCYANVRTPDRVTARLRGLAEHWREIALLDDISAAALIRADQLDLLIDLAGHTAHHRLGVMALRPAPVQATWLGYPNTTGLAAIDYRITDTLCDPPEATEHLHAEKLVRLTTNFSCYRPDPEAPAVSPLPASILHAAQPPGFTFGCFNNFAKVTPQVLALWTEILRAVPPSRLLLKLRGHADMTIAERVRRDLASAGVAPDRVAFHCEDLSVSAHLALYHRIDVALDPFPYHGTTTTCEALWMGVPVITLAGQVHAARVGVSLLTHVGLPEWIATSPTHYVELARAAASDLPRLAALRATLRERMRTSPLCDAETFTRNFESTLMAMAAKTA